MGSDLNVVNAARCSFAKEVDEIDIEKDTKLINYLARHNHWSPLAHTSVSVRIKAPIFLARQFVKHQIGLVWNEESRRYINSEPEFYVPDVWRAKPESVKQGSAGDMEKSVIYHNHCKYQAAECLKTYNYLLSEGVAAEQARMVLPQNTMTNWVWTGSLVAYARIVKLRTESHAQVEAHELANKIAEVVAPLYPISWKALMENMVA